MNCEEKLARVCTVIVSLEPNDEGQKAIYDLLKDILECPE